MEDSIKNYEFKTGLPQEFELVDFTKLSSEQPSTLTKAHRTGFYQIIWFQKGNPAHLVDFMPVTIKPNTLLFLNKGTVHRFDNKSEFECKGILFTDNFFCRSEADTKYLKNTTLFNDLFSASQIHIQSGQFMNLWYLMSNEFQTDKDEFQSSILRNLLHNFLLLAEREKRVQNFVPTKKGIDHEYVVLFKDLLETHYQSQKQVNYYTKNLMLTEKRLNQATSRVLGKSPKEIIDNRIILEAKRLLAHTNESVKEIGFALGFNEATNFIKYFKKHQKSTPLEFREKITLD